MRYKGMTLEQHKKCGELIKNARKLIFEVFREMTLGKYPVNSKVMRGISKLTAGSSQLDQLRSDLEDVMLSEHPEATLKVYYGGGH
jgi:hypothetical protein